MTQPFLSGQLDRRVKVDDLISDPDLVDQRFDLHVTLWPITSRNGGIPASGFLILTKLSTPDFDGVDQPLAQNLVNFLVQSCHPGIKVAIIFQVEMINGLLYLAEQ